VKKIIFITLLLFFSGISNVSAITYKDTNATCLYVQETSANEKNYLELKIRYEYDTQGNPDDSELIQIQMYTKDASGQKIYGGIDLGIADVHFYYKNWSSSIDDIVENYGQIYDYKTQSVVDKNRDRYLENSDESLVCPRNIYKLVNDDEYEFYACGNNYNATNMDTCQVTSQWLQELISDVDGDYSDYSYETYNYYTGTTVNTNGGIFDTDVQDQYNEIQERINKYCNTANTFNAVECSKAQEELSMILDQASDVGVDEEVLKKNYDNYKPSLNFGTADNCESILGKITDKNAPAYYLNFVFNLLKYATIILLFVLTIIDFAKATVASDKDALKKALQKSIKRLIIAIIIFFLPILLNFIFELLGWTTDPTCGIGGVK